MGVVPPTQVELSVPRFHWLVAEQGVNCHWWRILAGSLPHRWVMDLLADIVFSSFHLSRAKKALGCVFLGVKCSSCNTSKRVRYWRDPSPRYCSRAALIFLQKCCCGDESLLRWVQFDRPEVWTSNLLFLRRTREQWTEWPIIIGGGAFFGEKIFGIKYLFIQNVREWKGKKCLFAFLRFEARVWVKDFFGKTDLSLVRDGSELTKNR